MSVKNQKGFSLPEITVALGLMGGISLVTMKLVQDSATNEARLKSKAEVNKTVSLLKQMLNNPENCRAMLRTNSIGPLTNIVKPPEVTSGPDGLYLRVKRPGTTPPVYDYQQILIPNTKYQGFETGYIRLEYPANGATNVAELLIEFKYEKKSMFSDNDNSNNDSYIQRIPIIVTTAAGQVAECGPAVSDSNMSAKQKFCISLGAMATWTGTTCKFTTNKCNFGEVVRKVHSTGAVDCASIDTVIDPATLLDIAPCQSASGKFRLGLSGNKLKVICN